jgi:hypothetical protein
MYDDVIAGWASPRPTDLHGRPHRETTRVSTEAWEYGCGVYTGSGGSEDIHCCVYFLVLSSIIFYFVGFFPNLFAVLLLLSLETSHHSRTLNNKAEASNILII